MEETRKRARDASDAEAGNTIPKRALAASALTLQDLPDDVLSLLFADLSVRDLYCLRGLSTHMRDFFYHSVPVFKIGGSCELAKDVISLLDALPHFRVRVLKLANLPALLDGAVGLIVQDCPELTRISIKRCHMITGGVFGQFSHTFPRLTDIRLPDVPLSVSVLPLFRQCTALAVLRLKLAGNCVFKKTDMLAFLSNLPDLRDLYLDAGDDSDLPTFMGRDTTRSRAFLLANILPTIGTRCPSLQRLVLKGSRYSSCEANIVAGFAHSCPDLRLFHCSAQWLESRSGFALHEHCTNLTSLKMHHVSDMESLSGLKLRRVAMKSPSRITSVAQGVVEELPIQKLQLNDCRFFPKRLPALTKLKLIHYATRTMDPVKRLILSATCLRRLQLYYCVMTNSAMGEIFNHCSMLKELSLRSVNYAGAETDALTCHTVQQAVIRTGTHLQTLQLANVGELTDMFFLQLSRSTPNLRVFKYASAPTLVTAPVFARFASACKHLRVLKLGGVWSFKYLMEIPRCCEHLQVLRMHVDAPSRHGLHTLCTNICALLRWLRRLDLGPYAEFEHDSVRDLCHMLGLRILYCHAQASFGYGSFALLQKALAPHGIKVM
eukprot:TRINITY_DN8183_c0_g1_i2.p1 TRINITY_DN8183_c0_g1~~TRINITY_DN8183_c0_g1_i2.p1  ORF type:complete len:606 (+),score=68.63 TRINITY_DN8183_c0_g1_i2:170-1987(+)